MRVSFRVVNVLEENVCVCAHVVQQEITSPATIPDNKHDQTTHPSTT